MDINQIMTSALYDQMFINRVNYYLVKYAIEITTELPTTQYHDSRMKFANDVLTGRFDVKYFAIGVLTNPTIASAVDTASIPDGDIEFQTASQLNSFVLAIYGSN